MSNRMPGSDGERPVIRERCGYRSPDGPVRLLTMLAVFGAILVTTAYSEPADRLVVYSGRAERLIKPVLDVFQAKTGIQIDLLSSGTTELVNRLQAEGDRTPADLFLTNDAGRLERARELGLLRPLPMRDIERAVPAQFRAPDNSWVGLSGRFWIRAYNNRLVEPETAESIRALPEPRWQDHGAV